MLPLENQLQQKIHSISQQSSSKYADRDVGCFLQFFEVVMADLTGPAAPWDTCLIKLKNSSAERQASLLGGFERTFCARTSSRAVICNL
jgi:hypothetical protein